VRSCGWWRKGLTNGEIAECLVISPLSAETHVSNLLRTRLPRTRNAHLRVRVVGHA
jgi:DNA-binding NarL/FixJ family response regulator